MVKITVVSRDGSEHSFEGAVGTTVMDVIREGGVGELLALCGGSCSCATCHVYIDPEYVGKLPPMKHDEQDLLAYLDHRKETSRLSCQIPLRADLDGMRVVVANED